MTNLFKKINKEGNLLYPERKAYQNYYTITNSNCINNLLFDGAIIIAKLLDKKEVNAEMFHKKFVKYTDANILRAEELVFEINTNLATAGTDATNWFKSTFSDDLEKIKTEGIEAKSRIKINTELTRAGNVAKAIVVDSSKDEISYMFHILFNGIPEEDVCETVNVAKDKACALIDTISTNLVELIIGTDNVPPIINPVQQQAVINPAQQQAVINPAQQTPPVFVQPTVVPKVNVQVQPMSDDMVAVDPNSFIVPTATSYYIPTFDNEDINKHFIITDAVALPMSDDGSVLRDKLLTQAIMLNGHDTMLGNTNPTKMTISLFNNNDDWVAELVDDSGKIVDANDARYMRIICTDKGCTLFRKATPQQQNKTEKGKNKSKK